MDECLIIFLLQYLFRVVRQNVSLFVFKVEEEVRRLVDMHKRVFKRGLGQSCSFMENIAVAGAGDAHQLRFDRPREGWASVAHEDGIGALLIDIFDVDEKSIDVEDAGPHRREIGAWHPERGGDGWPELGRRLQHVRKWLM